MAALVSISSQVARGHVGNSATVFVLQRLGHAVWAVPTVVLPYHPGHGHAHAVATGPADLAALLKDLAESQWIGEVAAVLSGYLADPAQTEAIVSFVQAVKRRNGEALYSCDPILGDAGRLYVPEAVAAAVRDRLLPEADIITPDLFELGWLSGSTPREPSDIVAAAKALGVPAAPVTSAPALRRGGIATLLSGPSGAWLAETRELSGVPHGTGDLITALFMARKLSGAKDEAALESASASLFDILSRTVRARLDELALVEAQDALIRAAAPVRMHRIGV
jgi:pyridoxine kinase